MTVKELSETAGVSDPAKALAQEDSTPGSYLENLQKQELHQDAIKFQAYKMPTDAGIKWASASIKELRSPESKQQKDETLDAVDAWVKAPGDETRFAAKKAADNAKKSDASKLAALAVFMSGGSLAPPNAPHTPPPQYSAQKLISGSLVAAVLSYEPAKAKERYQKALALAKTFDTPA
ncbi:MAG TPA: hypothetical protein VMB03_17065 [Bryobacteraceae bacterium]|nr:hypothetical protein [Bryobacteraceae bacterium]